MGARRKGRELAVQMLYEWDVTRKPIEDVVGSISELQSAGDTARGFAGRLAEGTVDRVEDIDKLIAASSEHWRLSRMSVVDRNILRLAVYELLAKSAPPGVVINEAIEIAKRFSSEDSASFLNGVLDGVSSRLEAAASS